MKTLLFYFLTCSTVFGFQTEYRVEPVLSLPKGRASSLDILREARTFTYEKGVADTILSSRFIADSGNYIATPKRRARTLDLRAFLNLEFGQYSPVAWLSQPPSLPTGIYCYGGGQRTKQRNTPQSADTFDECNRMSNIMEFTTNAQQEYDTAQAFTVLCRNNSSPNGIAGFPYASGGNDNRSNDPNRFVEFREWLKSVLYLRTDTLWYCTDVDNIIHTIGMYYEGVHGYDLNGTEAIIRYIVSHQRCDSAWTARIRSEIVFPAALYALWRDTVKDSLTEPRPDTTVPSIDSIGLSILRGPQYAGIKETLPPPGTPEITGLSATENPFTNATAIKFNLADYGLVTFQLYDLLGNAVTTNGIGQVLYPGEHEFDIDGSKLAPGTYVARVAFHEGEVRSIMVVRK